jgi:dephospho-CoA kinase
MLGWCTIETDRLAKQAAVSTPAQDYLRECFGGLIPASADFKARFFTDASFRRGWEGVLHPLVRSRWQGELKAQPIANWVVELPLLYENKLEGGVRCCRSMYM